MVLDTTQFQVIPYGRIIQRWQLSVKALVKHVIKMYIL